MVRAWPLVEAGRCWFTRRQADEASRSDFKKGLEVIAPASEMFVDLQTAKAWANSA
jgi:hypothetical protein